MIELLEDEGIHLTANQMTELLGVVNQEELLEVEKKIEKTLKQADIKTADDIGHVLQTKGSQRICVEEVLVADMENQIQRKKTEPEKHLDVVDVEQILSIVKTKHVEPKKEISEMEPIFFRARVKSTGANP